MAREPARRSDPQLPHPAVKAMLLCDQIIQQAGTNRVTLVGILDRVTSPEFPFDYARGVGVYVRITDASGEYAIRMDLVRLEDEHIVGRREMTTLITDRRNAYEIILDLPRVPFERPGEYEFRFLANSRFVGAAVLSVEDDE